MPIAVHHVKGCGDNATGQPGQDVRCRHRQPIIKIKYSVIVNGTLGGAAETSVRSSAAGKALDACSAERGLARKDGYR
jgi:hypothetical protein